MTEPLDLEARISVARDHLTAKLTELHRRQTAVVTALAPLRHFANPWLGVGIAMFVGYRLGGRAPVEHIETTVHNRPSLVRSIVRVTALVVAETLARRVVSRLSERVMPSADG